MSTALVVTGGLIALLALALVLLLWRLHALGRRVGSFECALREGEHWHAGIVTYARDRLDWHRVVSLSPRPSRTWPREELIIDGRRPRQLEGRTSRVVEVQCQWAGRDFQLAAQAGALDGMVSWLEAMPPRSRGKSI